MRVIYDQGFYKMFNITRDEEKVIQTIQFAQMLGKLLKII